MLRRPQALEWVSVGIEAVREDPAGGRVVWVRTVGGRDLRLPRSAVYFRPGVVMVPLWLWRKIGRCVDAGNAEDDAG